MNLWTKNYNESNQRVYLLRTPIFNGFCNSLGSKMLWFWNGFWYHVSKSPYMVGCGRSTIQINVFWCFYLSAQLRFYMKQAGVRHKTLCLLREELRGLFWARKRGFQGSFWDCFWLQNRAVSESKLRMNFQLFLTSAQEGLRHGADLTPLPRSGTGF